MTALVANEINCLLWVVKFGMDSGITGNINNSNVRKAIDVDADYNQAMAERETGGDEGVWRKQQHAQFDQAMAGSRFLKDVRR
ncbi:hypothetical protein DVH24_019907 [Malus domestica]|uniref:Uncharacterized protein n=1 Tax=Malus domestica TaxID=3750 RepID=A0A498I246_MALDO|nr:hypothetical protein DVH24_019907 [Malus domestica]